jgi:hypothetical protein
MITGYTVCVCNLKFSVNSQDLFEVSTSFDGTHCSRQTCQTSLVRSDQFHAQIVSHVARSPLFLPTSIKRMRSALFPILNCSYLTVLQLLNICKNFVCVIRKCGTHSATSTGSKLAICGNQMCVAQPYFQIEAYILLQLWLTRDPIVSVDQLTDYKTNQVMLTGIVDSLNNVTATTWIKYHGLSAAQYGIVKRKVK